MLPFYRKWCTISGTLSTFCGQLIKADTHKRKFALPPTLGNTAQMRLRIASSQALHPSFCPFGAKAQSRRCSSLPHQTHFVGLCWGPRDLFCRKFVCKTLGNTAQMCLRATADLLTRKCVIFSRNTQSIPSKNCLFPCQNLWLNPLADSPGTAPIFYQI